VKAIRMWHSAIGDDGACALAELLRLGGAEVTVEYLEVGAQTISVFFF